MINSFLTPLLYVLAMGVLLGGYIDSGPDQLEGATSYLGFVAPGLIAAQSMQLVVSETTYPVMGMVKWQRIAFGMTVAWYAIGALALRRVDTRPYAVQLAEREAPLEEPLAATFS